MNVRNILFITNLFFSPLYAQEEKLLTTELTKIKSHDALNEERAAGEIIFTLGDICKDEIKQLNVTEIDHCSPRSQTDPFSEQITNLSHFFNKMDEHTNEIQYKQACQYLRELEKHYPVISHYVKDQNDETWKIKIYFGNTKTWYNKTDLNVKTSRLDLKIDQSQPYERRSTENLNWHNWVDEPTNTMYLSFSKIKNKLIFSMFHPKFVFVEGDQEFKGHQYNEKVHVSGTADGYKIDGVQKLKGNFGPNRELIPGQVYFVNWENAHKLLQFELGYGHEYTLIKGKGKPEIKVSPEISAGLYTGILNSSYSKRDNGWEWDQYESEKMKVMGKSLSAGATVEVNDSKDRVGIFIQGKYSAGKMKYDFLDGKASHDLNYKSLTMGVNIKLIGKKQSDDQFGR